MKTYNKIKNVLIISLALLSIQVFASDIYSVNFQTLPTARAQVNPKPATAFSVDYGSETRNLSGSWTTRGRRATSAWAIIDRTGLRLNNLASYALSPSFTPTPEDARLSINIGAKGNGSPSLRFYAVRNSGTDVRVFDNQRLSATSRTVILPAGTVRIKIKTLGGSDNVYAAVKNLRVFPEQPQNRFLGQFNGTDWVVYNTRAKKLLTISNWTKNLWQADAHKPNAITNWRWFGAMRSTSSPIKKVVFDSKRNRLIAFYHDGVFARNFNQSGNFQGNWYNILSSNNGAIQGGDISYTYDNINDRIIVVRHNNELHAVGFITGNSRLQPTSTRIGDNRFLSNIRDVAFYGSGNLIFNEGGRLTAHGLWSNGNLNWRKRNLGTIPGDSRLLVRPSHRALLVIERNGRTNQKVLNF